MALLQFLLNICGRYRRVVGGRMALGAVIMLASIVGLRWIRAGRGGSSAREIAAMRRARHVIGKGKILGRYLQSLPWTNSRGRTRPLLLVKVLLRERRTQKVATPNEITATRSRLRP
jgi:hypothetical protein